MKKQLIIAGMILCLSIPPLFTGDGEILAIKNGKLYTITKGILENGTILIQEGKIAAIGKNLTVPKNARIIDASNLTVLPGFIDAFTNLGTADTVPSNNDSDEATSPITPHLQIIDAINPENRFIPLARQNGVTSLLCAPGEGNLLSGQSALIHLAGNSIEEMLIEFPVAVHGNIGEVPKLRHGGKKGRYPSTRMGSAALLRQTLINAREYGEKLKHSPSPKNFKHESLVPVVKKERPLIIRANRLDDILTALRIADEFKIRIILNHAAEGYRVAEKLSAQNIPVLLGPVSSFYKREETSKANFENAAILQKAGVKIAFQTNSFLNYGDLILQAEKAVQHGLPYNEALKALTIYPAEIFGVEDRIGSLEKGKIADIILFEGEPLRRNSRIKMVLIKGRVY